MTPDHNQLALDADMPADELRLHMGELDAEQVRVARAAIRWANSVALTAQTATDAQMIPYEGWEVIVDQQGVSHHVPGSELLSKMSDKYYVPETDLAPKTVTRGELLKMADDMGGPIYPVTPEKLIDALIAAGVVKVTDEK